MIKNRNTLTLAGTRTRLTRIRELADAAERYALYIAINPDHADIVRYKQRLTQSLNGLASAAKSQSAKNRERR